MPHIPRTMAPSGLPLSSSAPRAAKKIETKKPVPYKSQSQATVASKERQSNNLIGKLSMKDWDVDPARIHQILKDKENH